MIALSGESADLLRRISSVTKISQAHLVEAIEGAKEAKGLRSDGAHHELRDAVMEILRDVYKTWRSTTERFFAGPRIVRQLLQGGDDLGGAADSRGEAETRSADNGEAIR